jgi:Tfp pilus assembly protein PilX
MKNSHKAQDGVALPVAVGMLMVLSILVVGFFTVAMHANTVSISDRSSKRALAAAEAGLQTALYRLHQLSRTPDPIAPTSCLTTLWVGLQPDGQCPGRTETLGNGATFSYWVTPEGGATGCVEMPGRTSTARDRCITSVGTVAGVTRRVQTRVASQPTIYPYNQVGLIGKSLVQAYNSAKLISDVGSNERVVFYNSVDVESNPSIDVDGRVMLLTGGTYQYRNSVTVDGGTQTVTTPFELTLPESEFEAVETTNSNSTLSADLGSAWDPGTRRIHIASGEKTIRPGTYHVCNVQLGNSVKLKFSHTGGAPTKIYVDSPSRPGSDLCRGQADPAGTFTADNSVEVNKEVGEREELLEIKMWGTPYNDTRAMYPWCEPIHQPNETATCRSDFMLENSVNFYGGIYAPNSSIQAHNSVKIWGAMAADKLLFFNSVDFTLTGEMKGRPPESSGSAQRKAWVECQPERTVSNDPESGC